MNLIPRDQQKKVLEYKEGYLGVAAVPGSGKTWTLSMLAAKLIADGLVKDNQRVLIVTLANSAVDNFSHHINLMIRNQGFLPGYGYKVRTLHGIAHDIIREKPGLVSLSEDFKILDERGSQSIIRDLVNKWWLSHKYALDDYLSEDLLANEKKAAWVREEKMPKVLQKLVEHFIKFVKDNQYSVDQTMEALEAVDTMPKLARMGIEIYLDYQKALAYRGAVDFSDLVLLANKVLSLDQSYLDRIRTRWPYVLEDEAQDSSLLQEKILRTIAGPDGNWVRVGDPNQAIYETFTTANPKYLRAFLDEADYSLDLSNSGRSALSIIDLANHLIRWSIEAHPIPEIRDALSKPYIQPTAQNDPQPNPADSLSRINLVQAGFSNIEELEYIAESVRAWIANATELTGAILVPSNNIGNEIVSHLRKSGVEPFDGLLGSTIETRHTAGAIANILSYLAEPYSAKKLSTVYRVWRKDERSDKNVVNEIEDISRLIGAIKKVEDFLWPTGEVSMEERLGNNTKLEPSQQTSISNFVEIVRNWQRLRTLPVDQIILALSWDLFEDPNDLALCHKFAQLLRSASEDNEDWGLDDLNRELIVIANNERNFLGMSTEEMGFEPENHKGEIVVCTIHKSKGLEWDRVYIVSANNFTFPSDPDNDKFFGEQWFIRSNLNIVAESLGQLKALIEQGDDESNYVEGESTKEARKDYIRERLRLLFVGITRAKRDLIITWTKGNPKFEPNTAALPFTELSDYILSGDS